MVARKNQEVKKKKKEEVCISRLQSMNGARKRKKSQHQKGKGSRGVVGMKLERPIIYLIISFPVI